MLDQREHLRERARQAEAIIRAIDAALAADDGIQERREKMEDLFDGFKPSPYRRGSAASVGQIGSVRRIGKADQALARLMTGRPSRPNRHQSTTMHTRP